MKLTQEQLNKATTLIELHLNDIGIQNQYTLLSVQHQPEHELIYVFSYEIANPTFKTIVQIEYNLAKENLQSESSPSFSWMDYKKITE